MKSTIVVFSVCFIAFVSAGGNTDVDYEEVSNLWIACNAKLKFDEVLDKNGELTEAWKKCAFSCFLKSFKLMNEDGSINIPTVLAHSKRLTEAKVKEDIAFCEAEVEEYEDTEEYSCHFANCFYKHRFFSDLE